MSKAQVDAGQRYNGDKNKSISRFILHPKFTNPMPRTERSLELKLARKMSKHYKRDLRGLWGTLAPGSTVIRTLPTTTTIKETGVPEVKARNSDIAKFGTRAERNTKLWQYAQRRLLPYDKTTEEKYFSNPRIPKRNSGMILRFGTVRQRLTLLLAFAPANSNMSKAMSSRKPKKSQAGKSRSCRSSATPGTSNASSVASLSITSSTASPTTSKSKRTRKSPDYFGFESSIC